MSVNAILHIESTDSRKILYAIGDVLQVVSTYMQIASDHLILMILCALFLVVDLG